MAEHRGSAPPTLPANGGRRASLGSRRRRLGAVFGGLVEILSPAEGEEWLVGLVVLLLVLGGFRHRIEPWLRTLGGEPPREAVEALAAVEPARFGRVDLNRADQGELESLPGIGPRLAARIIEDRERRGPFATIEDLDRVRGVGPHTIAGIRDAAIAGPDRRAE